MTELLAVRNVSKSFAGVHALDDVSRTLRELGLGELAVNVADFTHEEAERCDERPESGPSPDAARCTSSTFRCWKEPFSKSCGERPERRRSDSDDDVIDLCGAESAAPRGAEPGAPFVFSIDLTGDDDPDAASVADVKPKPEGIAALADGAREGGLSF